ncbi:MAG: ABC transporter ATP-binding protein [Saprospiraceae bacterium]
MIRFTDISLAYGSGPPVLRDFSLDLPGGGITGLLGPNGTGKTTLLKLICGLRFPDQGSVTTLGHTPRQRPVELLERLYFLPAENPLPDWTAEKLADYYGPFYPTFSTELYRELLEEFSAAGRGKMSRLSFGQKRRAQICFTLATRVPLLLLDEPTIGLDVQGQEQFRRSLIRATDEEQTVLIATHQLGQIAPVLDHLVVMRDTTDVARLDLAELETRYIFRLETSRPPVAHGLYQRRVPGGWLTVRPADRPGPAANAPGDLETLYLALSDADFAAALTNPAAHV